MLSFYECLITKPELKTVHSSFPGNFTFHVQKVIFLSCVHLYDPLIINTLLHCLYKPLKRYYIVSNIYCIC